MRTTHYLLSLSFLLAGLFSGCQNDMPEVFPQSESETESQKENFSAYTGETIRVEFDATLSDAEERNMSATRALKEGDDNFLHMDYSNWVGSVNVHLALRKVTDLNTITYKTVTGNISFTGGKYVLQIDPTSMQLKEGFFDDSEWEVAAMIDKRDQILQNGRYQNCEFNTMTYLDPNGDYDLKKMEIPIYSSYRDVIRQNSKILLPLKFYPLGCVITATIENSLYTTVDYTKINILNSNVIAGDLILNFGKTITSTGVPEVRRKVDKGGGICSFNFRTSLSAPTNIRRKIYLWCLPVNNWGIENPRFSMFYKLKNSTQDPDSVVYKSSKRLTYGFENSKNYRMNLKMPESDLMITEFGHLNTGGWNYSWIELFNPTNHDINLWQYGLVRVHEWEDNETSTVGIWQSFQIDGHRPSTMNYALIQNLHITQESNPIYHADGAIFSTYNIPNRFEFMYMNDEQIARYRGPGGNLLKPGKTVVLYAGGMRKYLHDKWDMRDPKWPSKEHGFKNYYLANAVAKNECQYVIAVDNGYYENAYAGMGDAGSSWGGTFQHANTNGILLLKREAVGSGSYKKILDAVAGTINGKLYNSFKSRLPARTLADLDWWWAGRSDNTMYPLGLRYPEDVQFATPFRAGTPWGSLDPFRFMDWNVFINSWWSFPHLISPGTRTYDEGVLNNGQKLPNARNEY